jgi:hypothetical protein
MLIYPSKEGYTLSNISFSPSYSFTDEIDIYITHTFFTWHILDNINFIDGIATNKVGIGISLDRFFSSKVGIIVFYNIKTEEWGTGIFYKILEFKKVKK